MTYFGVLITFILPPLLVLLVTVPRDLWRWLFRREGQVDWKPYLVVLAHVAMALIYTTPWDNYLVATGVWWYDPALVTGLRLGYVPIEEYTFFVVQTLLTGFWALALMRTRFKTPPQVTPSFSLRLGSTLAVLALWMVSTALWLSGWQPGVYLTLILSWALVPVMLQLAFGADILRANLRLVAWIVLPPTLYLWWVDALAITSGTWTINPAQTTGIMIGSLPLEEMVFFFMTNLIIGLGMTLMLSPDSLKRAQEWRRRYWHGRSLKQYLSLVGQDGPVLVWLGSLLLWLGVLIATPIVLWVSGETWFPLLAGLGVLAQFVATLLGLALGWSGRRILATLALVALFTWLVEAVGQATGLPFGRYAYTPALQPQLAGVPLLIPLAWMMMLAPAWAVAESILRPLRTRLGRLYWPAFAALTGLAFTAWDLYLDPQMVARGLWVWDPPGGYFGIPWSNYFGWWVSAALITLLVRPGGLPRFPLFIIYALTGVFQAIGLGIFWGQPGPALAGFVGMGVFALLAWRAEGRAWMSSFGRWSASFAVQSRSPSS
jgi:lycopene cyclase domain-containing protein